MFISGISEIPKILHLYWGKNRPLSFMRYMTYVSFKKNNPDWKIIVWTSNKPCNTIEWDTDEQKAFKYAGKDWMDELPVSVCSFYLEQASEIKKSDMFRFRILHEYGGIWCDFDILWIKSIDNVFIDKDKEFYTVFVENDKNTHETYASVGFMISKGRSIISLQAHNLSRKFMNETAYQSCGRFVIETILKNSNNWGNIHPDTVYPIRWYEPLRIFESKEDFTKQNTIGIHWFAGASVSSKYEVAIKNRDDLKHNSWFFNKMESLADA